LKKIIIPLVLGLLSVFLLVRLLSFYPEKEPEVISWKDAHRYYGQNVTIEGRIARTHNSGEACFLNFHENWKKYFTAVIFAKNFSKFPDHPEEYYYLKIVQVTGTVREYHGKPEIILRSPSQIKVIKQI
jgi:micrococcal nuclease